MTAEAAGDRHTARVAPWPDQEVAVGAVRVEAGPHGTHAPAASRHVPLDRLRDARAFLLRRRRDRSVRIHRFADDVPRDLQPCRRCLAEILASNNLILSHNKNDVSSSEQADNNDDINDDIDTNNHTNDMTNDVTNDVTNETNNETSANLNDNMDKQEKKEDQEKQIQENAIMSPSSASSVSTSEEDYELVRKNENVNHSKNKNNTDNSNNNMKYFEWLNIF